MLLCDVNVLAYAHREDTPSHTEYRNWLEDLINSDKAFGISDLALSGFLRIVTHPRIFNPPSPVQAALSFANQIRTQPNCIPVNPGPRYWEIFTRLCAEAEVAGNLIPDAFFAALAMESGCEWVTTDKDYHLFPGLRCRHPLH